MPTLDISTRPANIGGNIATRGERTGEEDTTAVSIPLRDLLLDEGDINRMMGLADAANRLFVVLGGASTPALQGASILLAEKFRNARVRLAGSFGKVEFLGAVVSRVKLTPQAGGATSMDCTVTARPTQNQKVDVLAMVNSPANVTIAGGASKSKDEGQGELPLPLAAPFARSEDGPPPTKGVEPPGRPGASGEESDDRRDFERAAKRKIEDHKRRVGVTARAPRGR